MHWTILVPRTTWLAAALGSLAGLASTVCPAAQTASWTQPDIDYWLYQHSSGGGTRRNGPTYGYLEVDGSTQQFVPQTALDPSRYGTALFAFDTSSFIAPGLAMSQYQIESVTMTAMIQDGSTATESLLYEPAAKTPAEHLAEYTTGGLTAQHPMEVFGVGFRGGFEGFALGPDQTGERFSESTAAYLDGGGGYVAFPIVGDGNGGYRDASNSVSGGFSATESSGQTDPFFAEPWAIGATNLQPGGDIPDFTTMTFQLDLEAAGVRSYVQQSLAAGSIGLILSSMHPTAQYGGAGAPPYPQWLMKEAVTGDFPIAGAEAATLEIVYTLVEESLAGDYDQSDDVDHQDYLTWKQLLGMASAEPGQGADGNGDGVVNLADYVVWRDHLGSGEAPPSTLGTATTVPEPSSARVVAMLVITVGFCGWVNWFTRPAASRRDEA